MTEREIVLRERAAFLRGWREWQSLEVGEEDCHQAVARIYPLPKITRPRVVADPDRNFAQGWRCFEGAIEYTPWIVSGKKQWFSLAPEKGDCIREGTLKWPTPERIKLWADLLANPNETVEE